MGKDDEKSWRRNDRFRRRPGETKSESPPMAYDKSAKLSIKQIAYLHEYCGKAVRDIVALYSRTLSASQAHLALAHYYANKAAIDAEISRDLEFDRKRSLHES